MMVAVTEIAREREKWSIEQKPRFSMRMALSEKTGQP
jgi:hypothetical protein